MSFRNSKKEDPFFEMFKTYAATIDRMGSDFGKIISHYHNVERAIADMKMTESECDDLSHVLLEELNKSFITPFDREDIFMITNQLDDIADYIEDTASKLQIYGVESIKDDAKELGELIDDATSEVSRLFCVLPERKKNKNAMENIIEINRLENLGDAVFRRALGKLFREEPDPIEIIRWKDIFENLEDTLDACEHLADTVRGVIVKNA